jgi:hypothetical protein
MRRRGRINRQRRAERMRQAALSARRAATERSAAEGRRRGCLFCRRGDGGFTSQEHIFPESLGNTEKLLPVGVVCDRCNHEVLSPLDEALCDFGPVSMMRTIYGIPSKRGQMPSFRLTTARWSAESPATSFSASTVRSGIRTTFLRPRAGPRGHSSRSATT